jgi:hypothetical protein
LYNIQNTENTKKQQNKKDRDSKVNQSLKHTRVYPKVSGLAAWSKNCKWNSSLPLGGVVSLFCESV